MALASSMSANGGSTLPSMRSQTQGIQRDGMTISGPIAMAVRNPSSVARSIARSSNRGDARKSSSARRSSLLKSAPGAQAGLSVMALLSKVDLVGRERSALGAVGFSHKAVASQASMSHSRWTSCDTRRPSVSSPRGMRLLRVV